MPCTLSASPEKKSAGKSGRRPGGRGKGEAQDGELHASGPPWRSPCGGSRPQRRKVTLRSGRGRRKPWTAYLDALKRAGKPLALAWRKGRFRVRLEDGAEPELPGWIARPFGIFRGTDAGPLYTGCHLYTLAYLPSERLVATFRTARPLQELGFRACADVG